MTRWLVDLYEQNPFTFGFLVAFVVAIIALAATGAA